MAGLVAGCRSVGSGGCVTSPQNRSRSRVDLLRGLVPQVRSDVARDVQGGADRPISLRSTFSSRFSSGGNTCSASAPGHRAELSCTRPANARSLAPWLQASLSDTAASLLAHSAALAGGHWQTSGWVCTAEVRGSTPLRSTRYLQGNRALRALRETFRKPLCNHPMLPKFGGTDGTGSDSSRLAGTDQCSEAVQLSRQSRVSRGTLSRHLRPHFADLRACTPIPIVSAVDGTSRRRPADHSDFGRAVREGSARLRAVPWPRGQTSRNAATTAGSNWLPALLRNSFWAAAWLSAGR